MYNSLRLTNVIPSRRNSVGPAAAGRGFVVITLALALAWLALWLTPKAFAVSPDPDGGYPNGNTAEGLNPLLNLTSGGYNTAIGYETLYNNTSGSENTATGALALYNNGTGNFNTANGNGALARNTTGAYNTAIGLGALNVANAADNTATGALALQATTSGFYNTATGVSALYENTIGYYNVASGVSALFYNVIGHDNTAEGFQALLNNKGSFNIGVGSNAGANLSNGSNNIDIGNVGVAGDAAKIRIGKQGTQTATYVAGIYGKTVASGTKVAVMIDSTGKLGTVVSSARFKKEIKPMDKISESVLALKPVTFRYKSDKTDTPQFGLVAEDVAEVNPDLVVCDKNGEIYTVRYDAVNAMLLNEFLKEHRKVEEQQATIAKQRKDFEAEITQLKKQMNTVVTRIKEHDSKIEKVTDELELRSHGLRTVANNH